ncbi:MAG: hypothetical protein AAFR13_02975 [Pseudomonadota bacterium]
MRFLLFTALVAILAFAPLHASAQLIDPDAPQAEPILPDEGAIVPQVDDVPTPQAQEKAEPDDRLNTLFAELKRTRDARLAKPIADGIWAEWYRSGSATVDLWMSWASEAAQRNDYNISLDYLDQVILRDPEFAEAWNRRATVHYQMSNFAKSMTDIQKVLELEPRHFGALSGMAAILERTGNKRAALNAWLRAVEVYPALPGAQDAIIRLSDELADEPV